jgi:hypothetical protein
MAEQLPLAIKEAVHKYYIHRERQTRDGWDKEADIILIDKMCSQEGWGYEAVAGHFWFSKKTLLGTHVIEITERTLPEGGYSNINDDKEPYGVFSWIVNVLKEPEPEHTNEDQRR